MRIKDIMRKSFQPESFIKVGRMEDGEPVPTLLEEVCQKLDPTYMTLRDSESGVIYLKKGKKKEEA